jgi:hypothetical protein
VISSTYSDTPVTVTGELSIEPGAPRSMGMDDPAAQTVVDANEERRSLVLHLHADVDGRTAIVSVSNAPDGQELYLDFGDGNGVTLTKDDTASGGADVTRTHIYLTDGSFLAVVYTLTGERDSAQLDIAVNWPPYGPEG